MRLGVPDSMQVIFLNWREEICLNGIKNRMPIDLAKFTEKFIGDELGKHFEDKEEFKSKFKFYSDAYIRETIMS